MKKKLQVFVSSTYTDLIDERQMAVQAILDAGHIPAGMELFKSGKSQMETIKKWIDESDVYCLILGGRYGTLENESGLSYTQLEYEYADSNGKPVIAIVLDDSMLYRKATDNPAVKFFEEENIIKYKTFKKNLLNHIVCRLVYSIPEIESKIISELYDISNTQSAELAGWIRGTKGAGTVHADSPFKFVEDTEITITNQDTNSKKTTLVNLDETSQDPMEYVKKGDHLFSMDCRNLQKSVQHYIYAIFLDPKCTEAYYNMIQNLTIGKDYTRALHYAEEACRLFPNHGNAYGCRAYVKTALKLYHESIEDCNRAISLLSNRWFYNTRGRCYLGLNQLNAALEDFAMANRLDPQYGPAVRNIKLTVGKIGISNVIETAIEEKEIALESKRKERYEKSKTYFHCVILSDPDNETGLQEYGGLYYDFHQYPDALRYWKKALEVHKCCKNYYLCAVAYKHLHAYSLTIEFCSLALKYPDDGYYSLVHDLLKNTPMESADAAPV